MNSFQNSDQADFDQLASTGRDITRGVNRVDGDLRETNSIMKSGFAENRQVLSTIKSGISNVGQGIAKIYNNNKQDYGIDTAQMKQNIAAMAGGPLAAAVQDVLQNSGISVGNIVKKSIGGIASMFHGHNDKLDGDIGRLSGINSRQLALDNNALAEEKKGNAVQKQQLAQSNEILKEAGKQTQLHQRQLNQDNINTDKIISALQSMEDSVSGVSNRRTGKRTNVSSSNNTLSNRSISDSNNFGTSLKSIRNDGTQKLSRSVQSVAKRSNDGLSSSPSDVLDLLRQIAENQEGLKNVFTDPQGKGEEPGIFKSLVMDLVTMPFGMKYWFSGRYAKDIHRSNNPFETTVNALLKIYEWERIGIDLSRRQLNELIKSSGGVTQNYVGHEGAAITAVKRVGKGIQRGITKTLGDGFFGRTTAKALSLPLTLLAFNDEDFKDQLYTRGMQVGMNLGKGDTFFDKITGSNKVTRRLYSERNLRQYKDRVMGSDVDNSEIPNIEKQLLKEIDSRDQGKLKNLKNDPEINLILTQLNKENSKTERNEEVIKFFLGQLKDTVKARASYYGLSGIHGSSFTEGDILSGFTKNSQYKNLKKDKWYTTDDLFKYKSENDNDKDLEKEIKKWMAIVDDNTSTREDKISAFKKINDAELQLKNSGKTAKARVGDSVIPVVIVEPSKKIRAELRKSIGGGMLPEMVFRTKLDTISASIGLNNHMSLAEQIVAGLEASTDGIAVRDIGEGNDIYIQNSKDQWNDLKRGSIENSERITKGIKESLEELKEEIKSQDPDHDKDSGRFDGIRSSTEVLNEEETEQTDIQSSILKLLTDWKKKNGDIDWSKIGSGKDDGSLFGSLFSGLGSLANGLGSLAGGLLSAGAGLAAFLGKLGLAAAGLGLIGYGAYKLYDIISKLFPNGKFEDIAVTGGGVGRMLAPKTPQQALNEIRRLNEAASSSKQKVAKLAQESAEFEMSEKSANEHLSDVTSRLNESKEKLSKLNNGDPEKLKIQEQIAELEYNEAQARQKVADAKLKLAEKQLQIAEQNEAIAKYESDAEKIKDDAKISKDGDMQASSEKLKAEQEKLSKLKQELEQIKAEYQASEKEFQQKQIERRAGQIAKERINASETDLNARHQAEVDRLQRIIDQNRSRISTLETQLSESQAKVSTAETALSTAETNHKVILEKVRQDKMLEVQKETELRVRKQWEKELQQKIDNARKTHSSQAKKLERELVTEKSKTDALSRELDEIKSKRIESEKQLEASKSDIERLKSELQESKTNNEKLQRELTTQRETLTQREAIHQKELADLKAKHAEELRNLQKTSPERVSTAVQKASQNAKTTDVQTPEDIDINRARENAEIARRDATQAKSRRDTAKTNSDNAVQKLEEAKKNLADLESEHHTAEYDAELYTEEGRTRILDRVNGSIEEANNNLASEQELLSEAKEKLHVTETRIKDLNTEKTNLQRRIQGVNAEATSGALTPENAENLIRKLNEKLVSTDTELKSTEELKSTLTDEIGIREKTVETRTEILEAAKKAKKSAQVDILKSTDSDIQMRGVRNYLQLENILDQAKTKLQTLEAKLSDIAKNPARYNKTAKSDTEAEIKELKETISKTENILKNDGSDIAKFNNEAEAFLKRSNNLSKFMSSKVVRTGTWALDKLGRSGGLLMGLGGGVNIYRGLFGKGDFGDTTKGTMELAEGLANLGGRSLGFGEYVMANALGNLIFDPQGQNLSTYYATRSINSGEYSTAIGDDLGRATTTIMTPAVGHASSALRTVGSLMVGNVEGAKAASPFVQAANATTRTGKVLRGVSAVAAPTATTALANTAVKGAGGRIVPLIGGMIDMGTGAYDANRHFKDGQYGKGTIDVLTFAAGVTTTVGAIGGMATGGVGFGIAVVVGAVVGTVLGCVKWCIASYENKKAKEIYDKNVSAFCDRTFQIKNNKAIEKIWQIKNLESRYSELVKEYKTNFIEKYKMESLDKRIDRYQKDLLFKKAFITKITDTENKIRKLNSELDNFKKDAQKYLNDRKWYIPNFIEDFFSLEKRSLDWRAQGLKAEDWENFTKESYEKGYDPYENIKNCSALELRAIIADDYIQKHQEIASSKQAKNLLPQAKAYITEKYLKSEYATDEDRELYRSALEFASSDDKDVKAYGEGLILSLGDKFQMKSNIEANGQSEYQNVLNEVNSYKESDILQFAELSRSILRENTEFSNRENKLTSNARKLFDILIKPNPLCVGPIFNALDIFVTSKSRDVSLINQVIILQAKIFQLYDQIKLLIKEMTYEDYHSLFEYMCTVSKSIFSKKKRDDDLASLKSLSEKSEYVKSLPYIQQLLEQEDRRTSEMEMIYQKYTPELITESDYYNTKDLFSDGVFYHYQLPHYKSSEDLFKGLGVYPNSLDLRTYPNQLPTVRTPNSLGLGAYPEGLPTVRTPNSLGLGAYPEGLPTVRTGTLPLKTQTENKPIPTLEEILEWTRTGKILDPKIYESLNELFAQDKIDIARSNGKPILNKNGGYIYITNGSKIVLNENNEPIKDNDGNPIIISEKGEIKFGRDINIPPLRKDLKGFKTGGLDVLQSPIIGKFLDTNEPSIIDPNQTQIVNEHFKGVDREGNVIELGEDGTEIIDRGNVIPINDGIYSDKFWNNLRTDYGFKEGYMQNPVAPNYSNYTDPNSFVQAFSKYIKDNKKNDGSNDDSDWQKAVLDFLGSIKESTKDIYKVTKENLLDIKDGFATGHFFDTFKNYFSELTDFLGDTFDEFIEDDKFREEFYEDAKKDLENAELSDDDFYSKYGVKKEEYSKANNDEKWKILKKSSKHSKNISDKYVEAKKEQTTPFDENYVTQEYADRTLLKELLDKEENAFKTDNYNSIESYDEFVADYKSKHPDQKDINPQQLQEEYNSKVQHHDKMMKGVYDEKLLSRKDVTYNDQFKDYFKDVNSKEDYDKLNDEEKEKAREEAYRLYIQDYKSRREKFKTESEAYKKEAQGKIDQKQKGFYSKFGGAQSKEDYEKYLQTHTNRQILTDVYGKSKEELEQHRESILQKVQEKKRKADPEVESRDKKRNVRQEIIKRARDAGLPDYLILKGINRVDDNVPEPNDEHFDNFIQQHVDVLKAELPTTPPTEAAVEAATIPTETPVAELPTTPPTEAAVEAATIPTETPVAELPTTPPTEAAVEAATIPTETPVAEAAKDATVTPPVAELPTTPPTEAAVEAATIPTETPVAELPATPVVEAAKDATVTPVVELPATPVVEAAKDATVTPVVEAANVSNKKPSIETPADIATSLSSVPLDEDAIQGIVPSSSNTDIELDVNDINPTLIPQNAPLDLNEDASVNKQVSISGSGFKFNSNITSKDQIIHKNPVLQQYYRYMFECGQNDIDKHLTMPAWKNYCKKNNIEWNFDDSHGLIEIKKFGDLIRDAGFWSKYKEEKENGNHVIGESASKTVSRSSQLSLDDDTKELIDRISSEEAKNITIEQLAKDNPLWHKGAFEWSNASSAFNRVHDTMADKTKDGSFTPLQLAYSYKYTEDKFRDKNNGFYKKRDDYAREMESNPEYQKLRLEDYDKYRSKSYNLWIRDPEKNWEHYLTEKYGPDRSKWDQDEDVRKAKELARNAEAIRQKFGLPAPLSEAPTTPPPVAAAETAPTVSAETPVAQPVTEAAAKVSEEVTTSAETPVAQSVTEAAAKVSEEVTTSAVTSTETQNIDYTNDDVFKREFVGRNYVFPRNVAVDSYTVKARSGTIVNVKIGSELDKKLRRRMRSDGRRKIDSISSMLKQRKAVKDAAGVQGSGNYRGTIVGGQVVEAQALADGGVTEGFSSTPVQEMNTLWGEAGLEAKIGLADGGSAFIPMNDQHTTMMNSLQKYISEGIKNGGIVPGNKNYKSGTTYSTDSDSEPMKRKLADDLLAGVRQSEFANGGVDIELSENNKHPGFLENVVNVLNGDGIGTDRELLEPIIKHMEKIGIENYFRSNDGVEDFIHKNPLSIEELPDGYKDGHITSRGTYEAVDMMLYHKYPELAKKYCNNDSSERSKRNNLILKSSIATRLERATRRQLLDSYGKGSKTISEMLLGTTKVPIEAIAHTENALRSGIGLIGDGIGSGINSIKNIFVDGGINNQEIQPLATGGVVQKPLIGEKGQEAIIPFNNSPESKNTMMELGGTIANSIANTFADGGFEDHKKIKILQEVSNFLDTSKPDVMKNISSDYSINTKSGQYANEQIIDGLNSTSSAIIASTSNVINKVTRGGSSNVITYNNTYNDPDYTYRVAEGSPAIMRS